MFSAGFVDCVAPEVEFQLLPFAFSCQSNINGFDIRSGAAQSGGKTVSVRNSAVSEGFRAQSQVVRLGQHTDGMVKRNLGLKEKAAIWAGWMRSDG